MIRLNSILLSALVAASSSVSWVGGQDKITADLLSEVPIPAAYEPGRLDVFQMEMYLSRGLTSKVIATAGTPMRYANGIKSTAPFHIEPDGAAVFDDTRGDNPGGWIYVSNSEADNGQGGVGAITFNAEGNVMDYKMLLTGTNRNCNGGKTDWNTWISCEEASDRTGKCWQVDPLGVRDPVAITLGSRGGAWEAFAHDTRNREVLYAFLTEDTDDGAIPRMTIRDPDYANPWNILLQDAPVDYLLLRPNSYFERSGGTFEWTKDETMARANAWEYYPNTEGMKLDDNILRIVSKTLDGFFLLNLDDNTYVFETAGFDGQPDQSTTIVEDDGSKMIYFTEEAHPVQGFLGAQVGIYTRNEAGEYTNILFGDYYSPETTGIAFSPDGMHMYFAYQGDGYLFDVTRTDGLSFFNHAAPATDPVAPEKPSLGDLITGGLSNLADWILPTTGARKEDENL